MTITAHNANTFFFKHAYSPFGKQVGTNIALTKMLACFFAGMRLNAVTLMNLMMAVGFGVEFCAHYARSFMLAPGDRVGRTLAALREIGPPIVNGGITTFLSILPVAFSGYKYFITYFFGFYSILIVVCLANALVLLPALLSFVGPAPYGPQAPTPLVSPRVPLRAFFKR